MQTVHYLQNDISSLMIQNKHITIKKSLYYVDLLLHQNINTNIPVRMYMNRKIRGTNCRRYGTKMHGTESSRYEMTDLVIILQAIGSHVDVLRRTENPVKIRCFGLSSSK